MPTPNDAINGSDSFDGMDRGWNVIKSLFMRTIEDRVARALWEDME